MGDDISFVSYKDKHILMISPKGKKELQHLIEKYQRGNATPEEKEFIEKYYQYFDREELITTLMNAEQKALLENRLFEKIAASIEEDQQKIIPLYKRSFVRISAVAASILLIVGLGGYFLFFNKTEKPIEIVTTLPADVEAPQASKAMITLANGKTVAIDSISSGTLAQQSDVTVTKTTDGKIIYSGNAHEIVYNILTNPRGSKVIDMQLADGSHVWLNAGSSVTYPVAFIGRERKVEITGEAYFEVKHDAAKPFYVSKGNMMLQVLGTHFNVNAYDDEDNIKVTLLEGSVKVSTENSEGLLKPGQQAQVTNDVKLLDNVDVGEVMAWKNGKFSFNRTGIRTVMRQLARWYDLDVEYKGEVTKDLFWGDMQRDLPLSKVLDFLKKSQVHFSVEGKKVVVMP